MNDPGDSAAKPSFGVISVRLLSVGENESLDVEDACMRCATEISTPIEGPRHAPRACRIGGGFSARHLTSTGDS